MKHDTFTDPAVIREVLAYAEKTSLTQAAARFGFSRKGVTGWRNRRAEVGPHWPTDQDITEWRNRRDERAEEREWMRTRTATYRARRKRHGGHLLIDNTGTMRRVQGLFALGYTSTDLAPHLGVKTSRVWQIGTGYWSKVHIETAIKIRRLYDEIWTTRPESWQADRQRCLAAKNGWAPCLAWDDDTIDDPTAEPEGIGQTRAHHADIDEVAVIRAMLGDRTIRLTTAERGEVARRLLAAGWSHARIEEHTGLKADRYQVVAA